MPGPGAPTQGLDAARSASEEALAADLTLALAGFSVDEADLQPLPTGSVMVAAAASRAARKLEVAGGAAALIKHARGIVARALDHCSSPGSSIDKEGEDLASLCFALRSAMGCAGRLGATDAEALFELAGVLWVSCGLAICAIIALKFQNGIAVGRQKLFCSTQHAHPAACSTTLFRGLLLPVPLLLERMHLLLQAP